MTTSDDSSPRRVLSFTGTRDELLDYLNGLTAAGHPLSPLGGGDWREYEWELTASVARHPAGKALGFCCSMASDFASSGVRHSDDCPRLDRGRGEDDR